MTTPQPSTFSFSNILPGQILRTGTGSRLLTDVGTKVRDIVTNLQRDLGSDPSLQLAVHELDGPALGLHYSSVAISTKSDPTCVLLMIGGSAQALPPIVENYNGVQCTTIRTPADSFDEAYVRIATNQLKNYLSTGAVSIIDCIVIQDGFNYNDGEALQRNVINAVQAIIRAVKTEQDLGVLDLARASTNDMISVSGQIGAVNEMGADGQPSFHTIKLQVVGCPRNVAGASVNGRQPALLAEVDAYVDMLWTPGQVPGPMGGFTYKYYTPRAVISLRSHAGLSLESYLLGLAASTSLSVNNLWATQYLQRSGPLDAGMLAIEANTTGAQGTPLKTDGADFNTDQLKAFLDMVCTGEMHYSVAVGRHGPEDFGQESFVEASRGVPDAAEQILRAANNLTGGKFSNIYRGSNPVIVNGSPQTGNSDVAIRGKFMGADGVYHSIAEVDNYVAYMARVWQVDQRAGALYTNTWMDNAAPTRVRVAERLSLVQQAIGTSNIQVTGYARLVTFNGEFLRALVQAVTNAGVPLQVSLNNPFQASSSRVGNLDYYRAAGLGSGSGIVGMPRTSSNGNGMSW